MRAYAKEVGVDAEPLLPYLPEHPPPAAHDEWGFSSEEDVDAFPRETASERPAAASTAGAAAPRDEPSVIRHDEPTTADHRDRGKTDRTVAPMGAAAPTATARVPAAASASIAATSPSGARRDSQLDDIPLNDTAPSPPPDVAYVRPRRSVAARLALPLVALIATAGWGAYLYERTRPLPAVGGSPVPAVQPRSAPPDASVQPPSASSDTTGATGAPRATTGSLAPDAATANAPAQPGAPAEAARAETPVAGSLPVLSGPWTLSTRVESTSYKRFVGLKLGYELQLQQDGDRITGEGRKIAENGKPLAAKSRTPLTVSGVRDGNAFTLRFTERGARRPSEGTFSLQLHEDGVLRGRFTSSAARSAGSVEARRSASTR